SQFRVPGVIFLAQARLEDPWYVAEHLIHEALHQKLYDIRHSHSVLLRDFGHETREGDDTPPRVISLWNAEDPPGANRWGPSRTLAALHVYAHLAVLGLLADEACDAGADLPARSDAAGTVSAASSFRRAVYLGRELMGEYRDELGPGGVALVDWLRQCLEL